MAHGGLGRRGEDRLGQAGALGQARRDRDAADLAGRLVGLQAQARQVAASDALDRDHVELLAPDRPARPFLGDVAGGDNVIGHQVVELVEPPQGQLGEDLPLARDGRRQHDIVDADPVRGDQQDVLAVRVNVADLAGMQQFHTVTPWSDGAR